MSPRRNRGAAPGPGSWVSASVGRAVGLFLLAGLVSIVVVGILLTVAQRRAAEAEAIRDARTLTHLEAQDVVGPMLSTEALSPGPEFDELDRVIRERVLGKLIVRVKIWDETGVIRYSDDRALIGERFPLPEEELEALRSGRTLAEVSNLDEPENRDERQFGRLLQVYLGVRTPSGQQLLFETYQPYDSISDASRRMWLTSLPVLLGGLGLLYLLQAPLALVMARRLLAAQEQREQFLLASLAASDRERTRIASDLHDGVVQGIAGASWTLSAAAAEATGRGERETAAVVGRTASDLRRWVRELRSLIVTVTPPDLHGQGLETSIRDLASVLEGRGIGVELSCQDTGLSESEEVLAYRVAQEAVRNVVKHSGASLVRISTLVRDGAGATPELVLVVVDDGVGFDPAAPVRSRGSVGLELLTATVVAEGGELKVTSTPGSGATVSLVLPLAATARGVGPIR